MDDDVPAPRRHVSWGTLLTVSLGMLSIVAYAVVVALEVGALRTTMALTVLRVDALEAHGSGPVQQSAERVAQIQSRVDRILTELLDMQKDVASIAVAQARQGERLDQLKGGSSGGK